MGSRNGRVGLIAAVAVAGVAVVAGSVLAGPVEVGPPRWVPSAHDRLPTMPAAPGDDGGVSYADNGGGHAGAIFVAIIEIVAVVVAVLLLALLVRVLVRRIADRGRKVRRDQVAASSGVFAVVDPDTAVPPPVMQRGIARALALLDEPRAPADAVVEAWLGLEDAAVAAGAGRGAAETAAEYATRIVARFDTDRDAARRLLRLYQDVRYGARQVDGGAVDTARACLLRLQESWHAASDAASGVDAAGPGAAPGADAAGRS